jgi:predicted acyltransferase
MGSASPQGAVQKRVMSVDALRGFDMFWIAGGGELVRRTIQLFVNPIPRGLQQQFGHADWVGFTAWDLIMPLFLFIVGTSMPLSFSKRIERGDSRGSLYAHTVRRVLILFVLGMIAQGNLLSFNPSKFHFYSNTLQAIAAGYLVATVVILNVTIIWQGVITAALLVLFWVLMMVAPVPGHGAGQLTPDGNFAMYVDEVILGRFRDGTPYTWILSSITFAATVMLGVMSGHLLQSKLAPKAKALWLTGAGLAGLAGGHVWGLWFPIIKHIWTSSFVLYAAGWSYLLLAFFYWVIDVLEFHKWAFGFAVIGMNAILTYMVTGFVSARHIERLLLGDAANALGRVPAFLSAAVVFGLIWLGLYGLYRKRIFIKI